ncbi:MAG TPA: hypothetical protein VN915_08555 [Elusimicrobiota bacterium]|nr:hypothetical protein [Elusimicrobiota bacterium]
MAQDEFDRLLEHCSERLAEISLSIPALEDGSPRPAVYTLEPQPPKPAPRPAAPPRPPEAAERPAEPAGVLPEAPAPAPAPEPFAEPAAESEVFPPPRAEERPPAPQWRPGPPRTPPPPTPVPASRGGRRAAAAAAAGVLAAAGAYVLWLMRRPAPDLDIELDRADAMAVRPERGDLLVAEGRGLVDMSRAGQTLGRQPLDAAVDTMCWDQGVLWTADGRTASVVERGEGGKDTVFSLNHVPAAIYAKDRYLWTAERNGAGLHQFLISRSILGAMLQPLDSFALDGISPESFTIDDKGTLWVADGPTRRLYRLKLENGSYKRASSAPLSPIVGPEGRLRGLTIDGDGVWMLAEHAGGGVALRRIAVSRFDWTK